MLTSRRQILRTAGLTALFGPFVNIAARGRAGAQALGPAKYLLIFHTTGTNIQRWTPAGSTIDNIVFSEMTETLAPLRSELVILENLDSMGSAAQHGQTGGLSGRGYSNRSSIDQFIADGLRANGVRTSIPVLNLGGNPREAPSTFQKGDNAITPIFEPATAFDGIFNGSVSSGVDVGALTARIQRKQSVLDLVTADLRDLSADLGAEERQRLELHAESIRNLERRLQDQLDSATDPDAEPTCGAPASLPSVEGLDKTALNLEMGITAMACDLTRVVAVEFGHHQSFQVEMDAPAIRGDWHNGFLHGEGGNDQLIGLERWLGTKFVEAANRLKSLPAPDGSGTLFDQTLMIWTRGMGDGLSHAGDDMRFVVTGSAGGYLRTSPNGRYLRANGEPHQTVLTACAEAMGVTDLSGFGDENNDRTPYAPLSG